MNPAQPNDMVAAVAALVQQRMTSAQPPAMAARILSLSDAATYLGMTEEAVRAKVRLGQIPQLKIDRKLRFDKLRLDKWIEDKNI